MVKRIHRKKWNKKLRRNELYAVWSCINSKAPNLSDKLVDGFAQALAQGW